MQIFVRYLMGKIIDFQVESPETIGHLKSKIQHIEGLEPNQQRFIILMENNWKTTAQYLIIIYRRRQ
ncbi:unnamed protein product [Aphis gossypii]|uniref:Ubiquitin-like domain-containing protein n=1 Tax=Aphis gossypii TaxID=80765 RepID=A0A9P0JDU1_APHGO|nr:unnamed protein product [Aphis gossypii]